MVVYNYSSKSSLQRLYNLTADEVRARMSIITYINYLHKGTIPGLGLSQKVVM